MTDPVKNIKTTVVIPADLYLEARLLGLTNLNEFVREGLQGFVDGQVEPIHDPVAARARQLAVELRAKSRQQQKITAQSEEELAKIAELKEQRRQRILTAMKKEMDSRGAYRFRRYMIDEHGDYAGIQDDILEAMSKDAGIPVQLCDVLELLKVVP